MGVRSSERIITLNIRESDTKTRIKGLNVPEQLVPSTMLGFAENCGKLGIGDFGLPPTRFFYHRAVLRSTVAELQLIDIE